MEHLLQHSFAGERLQGLPSFNPYFYGTSTSTLSPTVNTFSKDFVSILIFMEHLLQRTRRPSDLLFFVGFNPYFYGTSTST